MREETLRSLQRNIVLSHDLLERLHPLVGNVLRLIESLVRPPSAIYIRVNTLKISPDEYKSVLKRSRVDFLEDSHIDEAIGFRVRGPNSIGEVKGLKKVLVDKRAAESVIVGSDLFAPGIKAMDDDVSVNDEVVVLAPTGVPVAKGIALMSAREVRELRRGLAVRVTRSIYTTVKLSELPGAREGLFYAQSLPSMVAVKMLDPRPGEVIVDLTAAPGGKVSHVAQIVGRDSTIIAADRRSKVHKLRKTLMELGIDWVRVVGTDSRYFDREYPSLKGKVDKVIVDPPCSNLGVRPKVLENKNFKDVVSSAVYQRSFIKVAKALLKRGGRMLYSTCTVTWEENELNVSFAEDLGFSVVEPPSWVRRRWDFNGKGVRFCPLRHETPGFFATVMELSR